MLNWEVTVRLLALLFGLLHILLHTSASSIAGSKEESGSDKLHTPHTTALAYSRLPASAAAKDLLLEALSGYIYMSFYVFHIQKREKEKGEKSNRHWQEGIQYPELILPFDFKPSFFFPVRLGTEVCVAEADAFLA
jgi:hypothetical protein